MSYAIQANSELDRDPAAARHDAEAALAITPASVRSRLTQARALEKLGKHEEAKKAFAAAIQQAEQTAVAWYPGEIAQARKGLGP